MSASARSHPPGPLQMVRRHRVSIVALLALFALGYVVAGQAVGLKQSFSALKSGNLGLLAVAAGLLVGSWLAAAAIYHVLTLRHLRFGRTYLVQMAGSFASRALPSGIGSLGVNYLYLRRQGCSAAVAGAEVALNNTLGFCGHLLLLAALLLAVPGTWQFMHLRLSWWWLAGVGLAVMASLIVLRLFGRRWLSQVGALLRQYRRQPGRLILALLLSMVLTSCNILILWLAARIVGHDITVTVAAVALTVGVAAQTATPTPGGLGGVEAGIMAALLVWQVPAASALATAFIFRLVTFWLPLLVGGPVLVYVTRRGYL